MHGPSTSVARTIAAVAAAGLFLVVPNTAYAEVGRDAATPPDDQRQHAYLAAAKEFGVPESVLLGVSYLESRWDTNGGTPSTAAGYGPMHLTDVVAANTGTHHDHGAEDPRGDDARPAVRPKTTPAAVDSPQLRTVELAARLTGASTETLRTDPVQNIRGGAAVLAHYQRELGAAPSSDPAAWYDAVARYADVSTSGGNDFADEVFRTIADGVDRMTDDGQHVRLTARPELAAIGNSPSASGSSTWNDVECPTELACEWIPAPYQDLGGGDYGNHDIGNRPQSQKIEYIIIHDTEGTWNSALGLVQDPTYVSWHYTLRSSDGHIAQHVRSKDVGWHAGNWYVNAKSIGLEHEGFAAKGTWYTEAMYRTSAKLVRYLAARHRIPLDRAHILGHDNVPGTVPSTVAGMHWDPGPYWDWSHYFDLLGAPFRGTGDARAKVVTIRPDYGTNKPAFTGCDSPGTPCPARSSTSVILRSEPSPDAPLLSDIALRPDGSPATMGVSDIGSRVETGQQYVVAERKGDWTAVWYLGQKGWFRNPHHAPTAVSARSLVVTPKPGKATIPVFGRAYPEAEAYPAHIPAQNVVPLQYSLPAGQSYVAGLAVDSEYYWATTFDPATHTVVKGRTKYIQIQFGHRVAFVKADDVVVSPAM
jgi:hypothetical protein